MPERVRITDVSPRDGLQNEPGIIPTADKVRLIELLCQTGVDEIEVTSFVNPKWVPQLGDAAEVCAALPPPPRGRGQGGGLSPIPIAAHSPPFPINPPDRDPLRDPRALSHAQSLRRAMTGPEQLLWAKLRNRQVHGVKFRRQHPVGPYILDFYAMTHHLAIEVEGQTHAGAEVQASDRERTEYLAHFGVRVLRFTNDDVVRDVESVVRTIAAVVLGKQGVGVDGRVLVGKAEKPTPRPPPSGRGGEIYSSLVPNEHGLRAAFEVNRRAGYPLIEKVSVFTAASETFSRKNTNATIAETIERFKPVVAGAEDEGLEVRGYISCVVACPFEGPIAPAKVAEVAARLLDLGIEEIDLGDTIGTGTRESVGNMLEAVLPVVESERGPTPPPPPSGRGDGSHSTSTTPSAAPPSASRPRSTSACDPLTAPSLASAGARTPARRGSGLRATFPRNRWSAQCTKPGSRPVSISTRSSAQRRSRGRSWPSPEPRPGVRRERPGDPR